MTNNNTKKIKLSTLPSNYQKNQKVQYNSIRDTQSDLQIQFCNKIYTLQRSVLIKQSLFFQSICHRSQKKVIINERFSEIPFQNILSVIGGNVLEIQAQEIRAYYSIIRYLQIPKLENKIKQYIQQNILDLNIFNLIKMAHECSDQKIFEICLQQFQKQKFDQLLYNKLQLLNLQSTLFKMIIKSHNRYKHMTNKGLSYIQIYEILKDYCRVNNLPEGSLEQLKYQMLNLTSLTSQQYKQIFLDDMGIQVISDTQISSMKSIEHENNNGAVKKKSLIWTGSPKKKISVEGVNSKMKINLTQLQINYYKKKVVQLYQQNISLQEDLKSIKKMTEQNRQTHKKIDSQIQQIKKQLQTKRQFERQYLRKIMQCQRMLAQVQTQLDQKTQLIQRLFEKQQQLKLPKSQKSQSQDFNVQSQFLPASLIHEMMGGASSKLSKLTPAPKKWKDSKKLQIKQQENQEIIELKIKNQSQIINNIDLKLLSQYIPSVGFSNINNLQLIFRRSKNSYDIGQYNDIRNRNNLLIVIKTISGQKIGGYISTKISNTKIAYVQDKNAFLFTLTHKKKLKIKQKQYKQAIFLSQSYLISFSNDLLIAKDCLTQFSYCFWPCSYGQDQFTKNKGPTWFAGSSQYLTEILQIYQITQGEIEMIL